jgi:hypothetical protein
VRIANYPRHTATHVKTDSIGSRLQFAADSLFRLSLRTAVHLTMFS